MLRQAGYDVRYDEFEGGHTVPPDIARAAVDWLAAGAGRCDAARRLVNAPSNAAASGSIDCIVWVSSSPPCNAAKVARASVSGSASG